MIPASELTRWQRTLPFAISFLVVPLVWVGAVRGGWALALAPLYGWYVFPILDLLLGRDQDNPDPATPEALLSRYRLITLVWFPIQAATIFGTIWYATHTTHLSTGEKMALFAGVGVMSGSIGINFAHELMHQRSRLERWLADLLLASVLYSHFRSEHLLVHHVYVGTPRDAVTARYNEGFWRFLARVLPGCLRSALRAETTRLRAKNKPPFGPANPFWRYFALQAAAILAAALAGGPEGVALFVLQAFVAVLQLELVNYIEHYGLMRRKGPDGRYEHVKPQHSWNATQRASNWYLINLQRHSDHHYKPARPYPLLQTYPADAAPLLPAGYSLMTLAALVPPLFRRIMNPRVRAWRRRFYPQVTDWSPASA